MSEDIDAQVAAFEASLRAVVKRPISPTHKLLTTAVSHAEPVGNTKKTGSKTARKPAENQLYRWFFTLNYDGEPDEPVEPWAERLANIMKEFCKSFTFQLEQGNSQTKYIHWQGQFSLKVKHRREEVKNIMGDSRIHLEPTKKLWAAKNYTTKSETCIAGPWNERSEFIKTLDTDKLFDWQKSILEMVKKEPDDRSIIWIADPPGKNGKTTFCKYMAVKHGAVIMNNGASRDIAYAIGDNPKIVMFNYPRTVEGKLNYSILESIKDGMMFSSKYESKMKIFNAPHVVVMANFMPDFKTMTSDRWLVYTIKDKSLVAVPATPPAGDTEGDDSMFDDDPRNYH